MSFGRGKGVLFSNSGLGNKEWRPGISRPKTVKAARKGHSNENKAKNKSKRHEERPFECGELRHTGMIPSFFCFFFTEVSIQTSGWIAISYSPRLKPRKVGGKSFPVELKLGKVHFNNLIGIRVPMQRFPIGWFFSLYEKKVNLCTNEKVVKDRESIFWEEGWGKERRVIDARVKGQFFEGNLRIWES